MNGAGVAGDSIRRAGRYDFWRVECDMELDRGYTADVECVMRFRTLRRYLWVANLLLSRQVKYSSNRRYGL